MHVDMDQGGQNTVKTIVLFMIGILLVGFVVFMIKNSGDTNEVSTSLPENSLTTGSANTRGDILPTPEPTNTPMSSNNLNSQEVQGMSDQKMTVDQKLSVKAPTQMIDVTKKYTATLKTSMGDIVIALNAKNRPLTVGNFVYLAKIGFYNGVVFHRVIPDFMIQGGDPLGTGTGGPAYKFADELTAPNSNAKGTIAMANAGPNTNGSQFFINLVDNNYLDAKHTVFGKVTSGMAVVEAIGKTKTDSADKPLNPVTIETVEITDI